MNNVNLDIPLMSKSVFQEDVVRLSTSERIGLVLQNALDSEESDSEDEEKITEGHVLVSWYPRGQEEEVEESMLEVVDRSWLPGDIVRWADPSKGIMKGYVRKVKVDVAIKIIGTSYVLKNVNCSDLTPLQEFFPGLVVVLDSWIGVVDEVFVKLTLKLKNGARCTIEGEQVNLLTDITDHRDEESPYHCEMFYQGQCVSGTSRSFKDVQWINGPRPVFSTNQRINCIVQEVSIQNVRIHWQMQGYTGRTDAAMPTPSLPEPTISGDTVERLIFLNNFKEANIQIGDKAFYILKEKDLAANSVFGAEASAAVASSSASSAVASSSASSAVASSSASSAIASSSASSAVASSSVGQSGEVSSAAQVVEVDSIVASSVLVSSSQTASCATVAVVGSDEASNSRKTLENESVGEEGACKALHSQLNPKKDFGSLNLNAGESPTKAREVSSHREKPEYSGGRDSTSSEDSADDEDSDREAEKDSRAAVPSTLGMRRSDTRHQTSVVTSRAHAARRRRHYTRKKKKHQVPVRLAAGERVCVEITTTRTVVTVKWQDNTDEEDILSTELLPVLHVDDLEFFPGDFVVDKTNSSTQDGYGVVQRVDGTQRTCDIKWVKTTEPKNDNCFSVYDIGDHPDFNFRPGDVVVRLTSSENSDPANEAGPNSEVPPCGQVTHVDFDGRVNVIWTDKTISALSPENLYVVHTEDGDDWSSSANDHTNSDEGWETTSDVSSDQEQYHMNPLEDVIMRSLAAVGMNNQGAGNVGDEEEQGTGNVGGEEEQEIGEEKACQLPQADGESAKNMDVRPRSEEGRDSADHKESFLVITEVPESHRYFATTYQPTFPRQFTSTIRKEIIGLKSHLPAGVLVKGYENRMDLFSILIYGPADTPYEDGLFVFDLQLPSDYPKSPPSLHYVSQCTGRLNPNLYEDGTVCVSLLGTWNGKGTETWTSKSNICQLIISLQGLILCEEPYFNEAGYEKHRVSAEGAENSRVYNEMVLIKLLQSVEKIIKHPSETFLNEIEEYRSAQLPRLLSRIEMWLASFAPTKFLEEKFPDKSFLHRKVSKPIFPLLPLSYGFCVTLYRAWKSLSAVANNMSL